MRLVIRKVRHPPTPELDEPELTNPADIGLSNQPPKTLGEHTNTTPTAPPPDELPEPSTPAAAGSARA